MEVKKLSAGKYSFRGLKPGKAVLTVTTSLKNKNGKAYSKNLPITVKAKEEFQLKQADNSTLILEFLKPLSERVSLNPVKVSIDGEIVSDFTSELSGDRKTATLKFSSELKDEKEYLVSFQNFSASTMIHLKNQPVSIEILTKEAVAETPTDIELKILDKEGKDITSLIDQKNLSITVTGEEVSYDRLTNSLLFTKYDKTATVEASYPLSNGESVTATGTVKSIKSPEQIKREEELLAFYYYQASVDNRPKIKDIQLEFKDISGATEEVLTITMDKNIEDADKALYKKFSNYKIDVFNLYNNNTESVNWGEVKTSEDKISIQDDKIVMKLEGKTAITGVIPRENIRLTLSTINELPSSTKSLEQDFRRRVKLTPYVISRSDVGFKDSNDKTLSFVFREKIVYTKPSEVKLGTVPGSVVFNEAKNTLTFTFNTVNDLSLLKNGSVTEFETLGSAKVPAQENAQNIYEEGDSYRIKLVVNVSVNTYTAFEVQFVKE